MAHPKPPASRLRLLSLAVVTLAGCAAVAAANAIGCEQYAKATSSPAEVSRPVSAVLLGGQLCQTPSECSPAVLVRGAITPATLEAVHARASTSRPAQLWVCFQSPGGAHSTTLEGALPDNVRTCVADVIDEAGKRSRGLCASACAWVWLSARERALFGDNAVGFHRPYLHDAAVCTPGNLFHAGVAMAAGLLADLRDPDLPDRERATRQMLREEGFWRSASEVRELRRHEAFTLGLSAQAEGPVAVFQVAASSDQAAAAK